MTNLTLSTRVQQKSDEPNHLRNLSLRISSPTRFLNTNIEHSNIEMQSGAVEARIGFITQRSGDRNPVLLFLYFFHLINNWLKFNFLNVNFVLVAMTNPWRISRQPRPHIETPHESEVFVLHETEANHPVSANSTTDFVTSRINFRCFFSSTSPMKSSAWIWILFCNGGRSSQIFLIVFSPKVSNLRLIIAQCTIINCRICQTYVNNRGVYDY